MIFLVVIFVIAADNENISVRKTSKATVIYLPHSTKLYLYNYQVPVIPFRRQTNYMPLPPITGCKLAAVKERNKSKREGGEKERK